MNSISYLYALVLAFCVEFASVANAFAPVKTEAAAFRPALSNVPLTPRTSNTVMLMAEDGDESEGARPETKMSLDEKMQSWEASEEEIKAASLGGITAGSKGGTDGFDIGLWIMFPFIVATSLLFFVFPFIMDKIDVSSVGPPPMV